MDQYWPEGRRLVVGIAGVGADTGAEDDTGAVEGAGDDTGVAEGVGDDTGAAEGAGDGIEVEGARPGRGAVAQGAVPEGAEVPMSACPSLRECSKGWRLATWAYLPVVLPVVGGSSLPSWEGVAVWRCRPQPLAEGGTCAKPWGDWHWHKGWGLEQRGLPGAGR